MFASGQKEDLGGRGSGDIRCPAGMASAGTNHVTGRWCTTVVTTKPDGADIETQHEPWTRMAPS